MPARLSLGRVLFHHCELVVNQRAMAAAGDDLCAPGVWCGRTTDTASINPTARVHAARNAIAGARVASTLVTQAEEPQEEGPEEIAEVAPAVPTVLPDDPAAILSLLGLKGPKQRVIAEAVPKLYQRNPPENLTPTQLCEAVNGLQNTRAQASGARASPSQMVKWDTGDRFVRALR